MREIKFRAWDGKRMRNPSVNMLVDTHNGGAYWQSGYNEPDPMPECILMQYTGLKDGKGKEIYEGDILFRMKPKMFQDSPTRPEYAIVEYTEDTFVGRYSNRGEGSGNTGIKSFLTVPTPFEVIGNIYENPELLK